MKKSLSNFEDRQKYMAQILKADIDVIKKSSGMIPNTNIMYLSLTENYEPIPDGYKGGIIFLVDEYCKFLIGYSYQSDEELLSEFLNGKRSNLHELKK